MPRNAGRRLFAGVTRLRYSANGYSEDEIIPTPSVREPVPRRVSDAMREVRAEHGVSRAEREPTEVGDAGAHPEEREPVAAKGYSETKPFPAGRGVGIP